MEFIRTTACVAAVAALYALAGPPRPAIAAPPSCFAEAEATAYVIAGAGARLVTVTLPVRVEGDSAAAPAYARRRADRETLLRHACGRAAVEALRFARSAYQVSDLAQRICAASGTGGVLERITLVGRALHARIAARHDYRDVFRCPREARPPALAASPAKERQCRIYAKEMAAMDDLLRELGGGDAPSSAEAAHGARCLTSNSGALLKRARAHYRDVLRRAGQDRRDVAGAETALRKIEAASRAVR